MSAAIHEELNRRHARLFRLGRRHQRPLPGLRRPRIKPLPTFEQQAAAMRKQFGPAPEFGVIPWLVLEGETKPRNWSKPQPDLGYIPEPLPPALRNL